MEGKKYPVYTEKICAVDNMIWFAHSMVSVLFCINIINHEQRSWVIPYPSRIEDFYSDILYYKGQIYLIPGYASFFIVFDIERELFSKIEVSSVRNDERLWKYCSAVVYGQDLIAFPRDGLLTVIDLNNNMVREDVSYNVMINLRNERFYYAGFVNRDKVIAFPMGNKNIVVCDLFENNIRELDVELSENDYGVGIYDNQLFAFDPDKGTIRCITVENGEIIRTKKTEIKEHAYIAFVNNQFLYIDYVLSPQYDVFDRDLNHLQRGCNIVDGIGYSYNGTCFGVLTNMQNGNVVKFNNCRGELMIYDDFLKEPTDIIKVSISDSILLILPIPKSGINTAKPMI